MTRTRQETYRRFADTVGDPTWVFDLDERKLVFVGGRTAELCGYEPSEVMRLASMPKEVTAAAQDVVNLYSRLLPARIAAFEPSKKSSAPYVDQLLIPCKNGRRLWTETRTRIVRDEDTGHLLLCGSSHALEQAVEEDNDDSTSSTGGMLEIIERTAKIGAWAHDVLSGAGIWTRELSRIHDVDTFDPNVTGMLYEPSSRELLVKSLTEAMEHARPYDIELQVTSAKGVNKWIRSIGRPHLEGGRVVRVVGTSQDITDRKKIELQLTQERARLQSLFDTIPDLVFSKDHDGHFVACNARVEQLFGAPQSQILGKTDYDFVDQELADFFRKNDQIALENGCPTKNVETLTFADGHRETLEMIKAPVRAPDGSILGVLGVGRDITHMREADAALRASEERYRMLVENLDDVVFSTDVDGRVLFINRAISRFGYTPDAVIGRMRLEELIHPEDHSALTSREEIRLRDSKGQYRAQRSRTRRLVREDGKVVGLTGIFTDLTLLRETEQQLRAAQKMEAVGRLAGGVAHDFNNLLTVILSSADVVSDALAPEDPLREDIAHITAASRRAESLTRQLLAFSRRQVLQPESLRLNVVVEQLGDMLRRLIGEDIDLRIRSSAVAPTKLDRGQIEQVLMNLVVNARDAMPNGGVLTITTSNATIDDAGARKLEIAPGAYVEMLVQDTGAGMDSNTIARVFEPFFTTKAPGKGTGLGLSMAYGIVKQSGGGISVASEIGKGTCFSIYLPQDPGAPRRETESEHRTKRKIVRHGGNETILVVEDEASLRTVVKRILTNAGYEVLCAGSADEAITIATETTSSIALVLSDVVMPGMSGSDLVERLTATFPSMKVIFTSGYSDERLARFGVGNHHFLAKPFQADQLTESIRQVLDAPKSVPPST